MIEHRATELGAAAAELRAAVATRGRVHLATLPTPLHPLPRFSEWVGRETWVKRDDLTGLAFGGNKARKLEFILGAALPEDPDTVVTVGAEQSNHARSVAAAARIAGLECHLVLGGDRPPAPSGNLSLDAALGARLHFAGTEDWPRLERHAAALVDRLRADGRRPLLIPMGGSTPIGALGFVQGYLELLDQCADRGLAPDSIVVASSTGGTQAGLAYARAVIGSGPRILGVGVAKRPMDIAAEVDHLVHQLTELPGLPGLPTATADFPVVLDGYLGEGYARPSDGASRAAAELLRTEALFTDPVYSAKALHAVVDLARQEPSGGPLIFWHTGGTPALFAHSVGISRWPDGS